MIAQTANVEMKPVARVAKTEQTRVKEVVLLERVKLESFVRSMNGKFVTVDYTKLNEAPRTLNGRLGVKSYLKGGSNKVEAWDRPYLTVFDVQLLQYRTVSLDTATEIRAVGKIWRIVD